MSIYILKFYKEKYLIIKLYAFLSPIHTNNKIKYLNHLKLLGYRILLLITYIGEEYISYLISK